MSLAYAELLSNYVTDLLCSRLHSSGFRPLITNFYLTKRCNLRCRYCRSPVKEPELGTPAALGLLEKIRVHNPAINFTGGEPLLHEGLMRLLEKARALDFRPVMLSTNGVLIERLEPCLDLVDHLIISLDSLSDRVNDQIRGVSGITKQLKRSIERCASWAFRHGFHLSLHAVIAPETMGGIEDLVDYCEALNMTFSVSPEHAGVFPHPGLIRNAAYRRLIDRLISLKSDQRPLACSVSYLKAIRDFSSHKCYPHFSPRVEPDGRVYFPCQRMRQRHVYLQDYGSLVELMQAEARPAFLEQCSQKCFLACYMDVEQYIKNPLSLFREHRIRKWVVGEDLRRQPNPEAT